MDKQIKVKNIPTEVKIQKPDLSRQEDRFNPRNRIYVRAVTGLHQLLRQRIGFLGMLAVMLLPWINFNCTFRSCYINFKFCKFTITNSF